MIDKKHAAHLLISNVSGVIGSRCTDTSRTAHKVTIDKTFDFNKINKPVNVLHLLLHFHVEFRSLWENEIFLVPYDLPVNPLCLVRGQHQTCTEDWAPDYKKFGVLCLTFIERSLNVFNITWLSPQTSTPLPEDPPTCSTNYQPTTMLLKTSQTVLKKTEKQSVHFGSYSDSTFTESQCQDFKPHLVLQTKQVWLAFCSSQDIQVQTRSSCDCLVKKGQSI